MNALFFILSLVLVVIDGLPRVRHPHWIFRVWDFGRLQLLAVVLLVSIIGWLFVPDHTPWFYVMQGLLLLVVAHNAWLLAPYVPRPGKTNKSTKTHNASAEVSVVSANVYQFNTDYAYFIDLIGQTKPSLVLTMESNSDWERALRQIEKDYPYTHKQTQENTYGMHFYSKLEIVRAQTHRFVSEDIPSFEIDLKTEDGEAFTFFGVHPPPPSPTEEETSKERDGDLLSVAKAVRGRQNPVLVAGDFNNVAWARSSRLFYRTSGLIDPRRGYGFVSTFHAGYKLLRVPIDLLFHSRHIFIREFKTLGDIGSDHFPMYCSFWIDRGDVRQASEEPALEEGDREAAEQAIAEGKEEDGERPPVG